MESHYQQLNKCVIGTAGKDLSRFDGILRYTQDDNLLPNPLYKLPCLIFKSTSSPSFLMKAEPMMPPLIVIE
jgi:hypothetical protein